MRNRFIPKHAYSLLLALLPALLLCTSVNAQEPSITTIAKAWAVANFKLTDKAQTDAYDQLILEAESLVLHYESNGSQEEHVESLIWSGIVKSSYAGLQEGLTALKFAKSAKKELEQAEKINPIALSGSGLVTLGSLYNNVPGWPIGFGNPKKAQRYLERALEINPKGIDSNYFYALFLMTKEKYEEAQQALLRAKEATARPNRPIADEGRQKEIQTALNEVAAKLAL